MYKAGELMDICLDFPGRPEQYALLSPQSDLPDRERIRLQHFISGMRIKTTCAGENKTPRVVKKLSGAGAVD